MGGTRLGPATAGCTVVELDGRVVVHCPGTHEVQVLNESATAVWHLLDGTRSLDEVLAVLADDYDTSTEALRADVVEVVDRLVAAQVIASQP